MEWKREKVGNDGRGRKSEGRQIKTERREKERARQIGRERHTKRDRQTENMMTDQWHTWR